MSKAIIVIALDQQLLGELDVLAKQKRFPNRSKAIQTALENKISKDEANRFAKECTKFDAEIEQNLAEEDMTIALETWAAY